MKENPRKENFENYSEEKYVKNFSKLIKYI